MEDVPGIFAGLPMKIWIMAALQIVIRQECFLIRRKKGCLGGMESAEGMKEEKWQAAMPFLDIGRITRELRRLLTKI